MIYFNNSFTFLPVGQGLYYYGCLGFNQYNFIFDCGGNNQKLCNDLTTNIILRNNVKYLDFIVISHLHRDHCNGLRFILKNINTKMLILPYYGNHKEIMRLVYAYSFVDITNNDEPIEDMIEEINSLGSQDFTQTPGELIKKEGNYEYSKQNVSFKNNLMWNFIIYQKHLSSAKLDELDKKLATILNNFHCSNVIDFISKHGIRKIKKVYEEVFGNDLNETSLCMLHYSELDPISCVSNGQVISKNKYTLLTGDAMFDDEFSSVINKDICFRGAIVQVPHHGSNNNWVPFLNGLKAFDNYVVSYGINNKYGHPGTLFYGSNLNKINVNENTGLTYHFNFSEYDTIWRIM